MLKVFKYSVKVGADLVSLEMPKGAQLLSFQCQDEQPCLWALVDPAAEKETRNFRFAGTGHPIEEELSSLKFIGTAQMMGGCLIWHLFEIAPVTITSVTNART